LTTPSAPDDPKRSGGDPQPTDARRSWGLLLGSIGVVFGDIGTSPLYAMRETLARSGDNTEATVLGVVSLIFWALLVIVTFKYVVFIMRADNRGEGGPLALMALTQRALKKPSGVIFILGICGAALFYGDAVVTPAVSVIGAMEGIGEAPGAGPLLKSLVLPLSLAILVGLFMMQSRGTAVVGRLFGPVTLAWFLTLGALGFFHIFDDLSILRCLSPHYAVLYLLENGDRALFVLSGVFLAVTGAEALYADMGHFGRKPIARAWLFIVLPCLFLNYLGQGALVLSDPDTAGNPFFRMVPEQIYWPVFLLATAAAIIASQAVISGAFSLTQQAIQLGLLPRMRILRTSETEAGQVFIPSVNWMICAAVITLVVTMRTSSNLTNAYGVAVTGAMLVDTLLLFVAIRFLWKRSIAEAGLALLLFGTVDLVFFGANLLKVPQGAWVPLFLAAALVTVILTWSRGVRVLAARARRDSVPFEQLLRMLDSKLPHRTEGTAIFLTADPETTPVALLHNLKHNHVLHAQNIILTVKTADTPRTSPAERVHIETVNAYFKKVTVSFGFMETPNLPEALTLCRREGLKFDIMSTSFFLSRRTIKASHAAGLPMLQDRLFIFLNRNAGSPADYFRLPAGRVIEMGAQVII
jgi:KUP system potassium uptake protein